MNAGKRHAGAFVYACEFSDYDVQESVGGLAANVDDVIPPHLHRFVLRLVAGLAKQTIISVVPPRLSQMADSRFHAFDRRSRMSGEIELGNNFYVPRMCELKYFGEVVLRIETVAGRTCVIRKSSGAMRGDQGFRFVERVTAMCSDAGKLGQLLNFDAPTFIIRQVQMKPI